MVQYNFTGFFMPVENPPVMNRLKAGNGVPIKFSLNGNHGLSIIEAGYPKVQVIACDSLATLSDVAETISAGSSSLSYDLVQDRLTLLALLLENVGADAAVSLGDPNVWREAVAQPK